MDPLPYATDAIPHEPPPRLRWSWLIVSFFAASFARAVAFGGRRSFDAGHWLPGEHQTVLAIGFLALITFMGAAHSIVAVARHRPVLYLRLSLATLVAGLVVLNLLLTLMALIRSH